MAVSQALLFSSFLLFLLREHDHNRSDTETSAFRHAPGSKMPVAICPSSIIVSSCQISQRFCHLLSAMGHFAWLSSVPSIRCQWGHLTNPLSSLRWQEVSLCRCHHCQLLKTARGRRQRRKKHNRPLGLLDNCILLFAFAVAIIFVW